MGIGEIIALIKSLGGGGGGSVPKPLTYDYMPEGYPKKEMGTVTLLEEQEIAFTSIAEGGFYIAPATNAFEIVEGQTYTVSWDGTEYECVGAAFGEDRYVLGNLSIEGGGADTGEPFLYVYDVYDITQASGTFVTRDTSASHTISIKTVTEVITPMAEEFMPVLTSPNGTKYKLAVDDTGTLSATEVT